MMKYEELEHLIRDTVIAYEEGWNEANHPHESIELRLTVSKHKINVKGKSKDVAYIRLEREHFNLNEKEEKESTEVYLVYQKIYQFKNQAEIMEPEKWRRSLYSNLLASLIGAGIEHAEFTNRVRKMNTRAERKSEVLVNQEEAIQVTDKMPEPLTDKEKEYKEWVDKNNVNSKK